MAEPYYLNIRLISINKLKLDHIVGNYMISEKIRLLRLSWPPKKVTFELISKAICSYKNMGRRFIGRQNSKNKSMW